MLLDTQYHTHYYADSIGTGSSNENTCLHLLLHSVFFAQPAMNRTHPTYTYRYSGDSEIELPYEKVPLNLLLICWGPLNLPLLLICVLVGIYTLLDANELLFLKCYYKNTVLVTIYITDQDASFTHRARDWDTTDVTCSLVADNDGRRRLLA